MIPKQQLEDLGFVNVKPKLYLKNIGNYKVYRDYRGEKPISYAYKGSRTIDEKQTKKIKEVVAIEKIETLLPELEKMCFLMQTV